MSQKPSNKAAWAMGPKTLDLKIKDAPYTPPRANEITIRNRAVAMNPVDWIKQGPTGSLMYDWLSYPLILGNDVAGEVVAVGPNVTRFKPGDRVLGHAIGMDKGRKSTAEGAFQLYVNLVVHMATEIPASMTFEDACVIPLGLSTASCGLYEKDQLGLPFPSVKSKKTGKTVLIWGGSTSVGANAIQLAVASGFEVITTCSPRNFEFVKKLGAALAFDYRSKTVVRDIVEAFKNRTIGGALAIGDGAANACIEILGKSKGDKVLSMASYPMPSPMPESFVLPKTIFAFVTGNISISLKCKTKGIRSNYIFGSSLWANGVGKGVYEDYLPGALVEGSYVASPQPEVVGSGLESIQQALETQKKGVSAKKIVITL